MRRNAPALSMITLLALSLGLAISSAGCGDDEPEDTGPSTKLRGIYAIDTWTSNDAACDVEGPSILEMASSTKLAIKLDSSFGVDFLVAVPCSDPDSCANNAAAGLFAGFAGGALLNEGSDEAGWDGEGSSHSVDNGTCTGSYFTQRLTVIGDKRVRLETKVFETTFPVSGGGSSSDGDCPLESARKAAEGQPCKSLEALTATYEQTLADPPK
jgi:hypothetical protein